MDNTSEHINLGWLSKLPKESGHKTPEGYFDTIEDDFSAKLAEQNLPIENGFKIPEGYFNTLEDRILENIELSKREKVKVIPLRTRVARFVNAAAAAVIILFVGIYFNKYEIEPTSDEIAVWFEDNISTITSEDMTVVLTDEDFEDSSFLNDEIDGDEIIKYLDENDTYILIKDSDISINELN